MTYFCQGCSLHCPNCFNESLQDFNGGREFTREILEESMYMFNLFQNGYDGITLIGGECMDNLDFGIMVATEFKRRFPNKTIWIYSGYTYEEITSDKDKFELLKLCDVLVDGRFINKLKNLNLFFKGSENQRIVDIKKSLRKGKVVEYIIE